MMPPLATLPFAVGQGPFLIKGNNYRGSFTQYDALVPGGRKALFAAMTDPALRTYVEQDYL